MVYVLLGTGFEEMEALTPVDLLRRAGVEVATVGINGKIVYGSHKIGVEADIELSEMDLTNMDMIILPGGLGGVASVRASEPAMNALRYAWENDKFVAAICAGPTVLADLGITDGKNTTCYPSCVSGMGNANVEKDKAFVVDGKLITGTSAGCAVKFSLVLVAILCGYDKASEISDQIVIR